MSQALSASDIRKVSGSVVKEASAETISELLKREQEQLEELERSLSRSKEITANMFSLLDNFQERITGLEKDILPIYASTTKTRGLFQSKKFAFSLVFFVVLSLLTKDHTRHRRSDKRS